MSRLTTVMVTLGVVMSMVLRLCKDRPLSKVDSLLIRQGESQKGEGIILIAELLRQR